MNSSVCVFCAHILDLFIKSVLFWALKNKTETQLCDMLIIFISSKKPQLKLQSYLL